jgi:hypothetical protein
MTETLADILPPYKKNFGPDSLMNLKIYNT